MTTEAMRVQDVRRLIYLDTQFDARGETDLKLPEMQALEARGWIAEGEENGEYAVTKEGERVIQAALRSPAVAGLVEAATRLRSVSHHSTEMGWIGDGDPWGQIDSALANFTGDKP